ncbi:MAG: sulfatase-like hydrolase/transferase, partial [Candidatus Latescibacterota bacterium]
MSTKNRFIAVVLLGLVYLGLVFHDVASFRLRVILAQRTPGQVLDRLPGGPVFAAVAALVAVLAVFAVLKMAGARMGGSWGAARGRLVLIPLALLGLAAGIAVVVENPRFPAPLEWSGVGAAVAGASMVLFAWFPGRRGLVTAHVALFAVTAIALVIPHAIPGHRRQTDRIARLLERASEDLGRRGESWGLADPAELTADARAWATRHDVYRFDEHLEDVTGLEAHPGSNSGGLLFSVPADGRFVANDPGGPRSSTTDTSQVFPDYRGGAVLRTETALAVDWSRVGAFHITMTVSRGSNMQLFWGGSADDRGDGIRIPLGPSGRPASYVIKEKFIRNRGDGNVGYVWLVPSERDARVEIEQFSVVDRAHAALRGTPFGTGYENIDDEIRRVMFVSTPCRFSYEVEVPARSPRLLFGLGTASGDTPIAFNVTVSHGSEETKLFSMEWANNERWSDHDLDMTPWAAKTVEITFETVAPRGGLGLWSNPVLVGAPAAVPNVVVYLVDCLRPDHLGAYGYDRNTSPVFDSLSARGVLFERAYSNGPNTKLSVPSLMTSNPVSATGVRYGPDVLPESFPTLAGLLRLMGFSTTAFATNGNAGPYSGTHRGFSTLFGGQRIVRAAGPRFTDSDAEALVGDLMAEWIGRNKDRNFFMYVHTMDAHGPYDPPEAYRYYYEALDSATPAVRDAWLDPDWVTEPTGEGRVALYDGEIAYGDKHFGRFLEMLDDAGVLDNTLILFMADHGEYFGEHRLWGHMSPCFRQGTRIPLLIVGPGFPGGVRIGQNVQIVDIMPTILDAV